MAWAEPGTPTAFDPPAPLRGGRWLTVAALLAWAAVVAAAWKIGEPNRALWKLRGAPIAGFFDRHITPATFVVLAVGLVAARYLPGLCARLRWRQVVALTCIAAVGWGSALALTRGVDGLDRGLAHRHEYPAIVPVVDELGVQEFIDTFTDEPVLRTYPIHVQGHPVGSALLFAGLDRIGLGGSAGGAAFVLVVSASAFAAVLLAVREVGGEARARRVAPFLALAPAMVWWVTSGDALFATAGAWGTALMVLATAAGSSGRRRALLGIGSGLVWALGLHLSYGLVPLALVGTVVVVARRRWEVIGWAALGGVAMTVPWVLAGFWWFDGLAATRIRYEAGIARIRPYGHFSRIGNPAAFGLAIGPAAWVAVARVRDKALLILGLSALIAASVANVSGLSKAEVERIWLPFAIWVLVLPAGLAVTARSRRGDPDDGSVAADDGRDGLVRRAVPSWSPGWPPLAANLLAAHVVLAVIIESVVKTPW